MTNEAIKGALKVREEWEGMSFVDRSSIFLKAADLLAGKYRYELLAATMLGQGKNCWQAEIDAVAELCDFWRFNCAFAEQIYKQQPQLHSPGIYNRLEYRGLEGFVLAVAPFNFTAIGGNLASAPALMGNVVLWKPSGGAVHSNYLVYRVLQEAGLPDGVIQFLPGSPERVVQPAIKNGHFSGLHFTGSTQVFQSLWRDISANLTSYQGYPRLVGETGGKNFHFLHESADISSAINQTIRGAFEFQGQKCSATSQLFVPDTIWQSFKQGILEKMPQIIQSAPEENLAAFSGPVINHAAFHKIKKFIDLGRKDPSAKLIYGGNCDESRGYFIQPTIFETDSLDFTLLKEEIFGPVLSVFVYPANEYEKYLEIISKSSKYALTGSIFAQDRKAQILAEKILRPAAGNFYINDKSTGAVVGQQAFGGARWSGTNDKAGSSANLMRWVSMRTIKENFLPLQDFKYPSNFEEV
jgi:1-pyrroline-5-carboxylate dehydrogenase